MQVDINREFKFLVKSSEWGDILYSCIPAVFLKDYVLVSWVEPRGGTCATEYTKLEAAKYIKEGLWMIVGETDA